MRKLASVVIVKAIEPIAGADAIELARIAGWQCVTKKREFSIGDHGVYLEIDSIPPDSAQFRWLWTKKGETAIEGTRPASFRIRTLRLRGALSQGLLLPLASLGLTNAQEGDDLTEQLGIVKYEPPVPLGVGDQRAPFPSIVNKTDETRVQSFPLLLDEMRGRPFVATVKIDGTSATFLTMDGELHVCGRNHSVREGDNLYWYVARKHALATVLAANPRLVLQGEIAGPGIQKNPLALTDKALFVFSIFDASTARYLSDHELRAFCAAHALTPVPLAFEGEAFDETVESLLAKAEGRYQGTNNEREGIVIRPRAGDVLSNVLGGRLSFKAISNKFLLGERD